MIDTSPANIQVNEDGRLLYKDGTIVPLVVPMHKDEKKQMFKDIREDIRPMVIKICDDLFLKATEPMKRNIRDIDANIIILDKRINKRMDDELANLIDNFKLTLEE